MLIIITFTLSFDYCQSPTSFSIFNFKNKLLPTAAPLSFFFQFNIFVEMLLLFFLFIMAVMAMLLIFLFTIWLLLLIPQSHHRLDPAFHLLLYSFGMHRSLALDPQQPNLVVYLNDTGFTQISEILVLVRLLFLLQWTIVIVLMMIFFRISLD